MALSEFALGVEAQERFVVREPLRRVYECVFTVLAAYLVSGRARRVALWTSSWPSYDFSSRTRLEIIECDVQWKCLAALQRLIFRKNSIIRESPASFRPVGFLTQYIDHKGMGCLVGAGRKPHDSALEIFGEVEAGSGHEPHLTLLVVTKYHHHTGQSRRQRAGSLAHPDCIAASSFPAGSRK